MRMKQPVLDDVLLSARNASRGSRTLTHAPLRDHDGIPILHSLSDQHHVHPHPLPLNTHPHTTQWQLPTTPLPPPRRQAHQQ